MTTHEVALEIRGFVARETGTRDASIIADDQDLFAEGLLDSLMTVSLVTFCEQRFGCNIGPDEFSDEALRTIRGLAAFVSSRTGAGA